MSDEAAPTFISPEFVELEAGGATRRFYAVSLKVLCELRSVAKPVLTALTTIFTAPQQSVKESVRSGRDAGTIEKTTFEPMPADVVKLAAARRDEAMSTLIDSLLDAKNVALLRTLIVDSLRDEFERGKKLTPDQVKAFDEMDAPTAVEFIRGIVQANVKVFGPLPSGITAKAREAVAAVIPSN